MSEIISGGWTRQRELDKQRTSLSEAPDGSNCLVLMGTSEWSEETAQQFLSLSVDIEKHPPGFYNGLWHWC